MTAPQTASKLGFFGCSSHGGRLVCCEMAEPMKRMPKTAWVERCPNCGNSHPASLVWRHREARDDGRQPEVVLPVPELVDD
jgi:hypothetical protein